MASISNGKNWPAAEGNKYGKQEEELLVFGYSCKLFRDDEKASYIDHGKHLIPWMGDESLMIDRYDARGYLHDLRQYEPKAGVDYSLYMSQEDRAIEELCEEERYLALFRDLREEAIYQEEEIKRLNAALAADGAYHETGFSYDNVGSTSQGEKDADEGDAPFKLPAGLSIPSTVTLPNSMKLHTIIEKTACFVSQHGPQMEIIIKTKQASNPQFSFLSFDDSLNVYYRCLVDQIKSGSYIPVSETKSEDSDDDDDSYLHPSLFAAKSHTPFTVPKLYKKDGEDDAYSWLVRNLKEKVQHSNPSSPPIHNQNEPTTSNETLSVPDYSQNIQESDYPEQYQQAVTQQESENIEQTSWEYRENEYIIPPPPDIEPIIDKMAVYVAKNGEDFETIVKSKGDKRFEFLLPDHKYYPYYLYKKQVYQHEKWQEQVSEPVQYGPHLQSEQEDEPSEMKLEQETGENVLKDDPSVVNPNEVNLMMEVDGPKFEMQDEQKPSESCFISEVKRDTDLSPSMSPQTESENSLPPKTEDKVPKGPVSFSLKPKAEEPLEKKRVVLAESDSEGDYLDSMLAESEDPKSSSRLASTSSELSNQPEGKAEIKDKKLQELKDRLCAAVREKMSHSRQLQLERKRKAAQFLSMLKQTPSLNFTNLSDASKKPETASVSKPDTSSIVLRRSPTGSLPSSPRLSKDRSRSPEQFSHHSRNRLRRRSPSPHSRRHHGTHSRISSRHRSRSPSPHRHHRYDRHRISSHSYSKSKRSRTRTPSPPYRRKSRSRSKDKSRRK